MRNNMGFGKFEVMTMITLLLVVFCVLAYLLLNGVSNQKIDTMKDNAISFSKVVTTNIASFHNTETVFLGEAIDENLLGDIKSPFGGGVCSREESFVHLEDGLPYVTLKCGNHLIENTNFSSKDINVYIVSEWSENKKNDDDEETTLYNCEDGGEIAFDQYYPELYFVYQSNKKFDGNAYFADGVHNCEVVTKKFYRSRKVLGK